jgi:hypothetical protein
LFFREFHGAETGLIQARRRLSRFGLARLFRALIFLRPGFVPGIAFFVARAVFPGAALGLFITRTACRMLRLMAGRLNAAERAAQFLNLPLIGQFLAFGNLNQFKDFVQLVNRVLERLGNFRCVCHGLADGRRFRRAKISRSRPGLGFGTALLRVSRTLGTLGTPLTFRFRFPRRGHFGGG